MSRINDKPTIVTYTTTYTKAVGIGHHNCYNCDVETPEPPESELILFCQKTAGHDHYIWPGDDWMPAKWDIFNGKLICPECSNTVKEALKLRKLLVDEEKSAQAAQLPPV